MGNEFEKATPRPWDMRPEYDYGEDEDGVKETGEIIAWRVGPGDAEGRDYLADVHCEVPSDDGSSRSDEESEANARLIVRAVNSYEPMRRMLAFVQWGIGGCVACGGVKSTGHEADCKVAAALRAADGEGAK